ncbi:MULTISPECIES: flavodoxin family protein [Anaerostipes]|uniref:flavodoxin family protein n=1 Tax=Anaerostipes TaxID=207244 RepID=UPI002586D65F|nr:flavodoxin family protein [Anaerostipes sp.]MCI5622360.1 flavodoxin family protein [Anaerostipes sp.]MDY2725959.1 flavodoxin family protein [Anaerostipes faecalis]
MKYAVIYQSKSGNTRKIAREIYEAIDSDEKEIYDIDSKGEVPEADLYFVGFGIRNGICGVDILDVLEELPESRLAFFATCGFLATEQYRKNLEKRLDVWIPEKAEYMGMFLCQGNVKPDNRATIIEKMPQQADKLRQMFEVGSTHPDEDDLSRACQYAREIQQMAERSGSIPIW